MLLIFSLSLQLVKLFRKVQWRDRSERSVLNGFYISLGTEESLPVCLQLPCTAGPILSTEDTVPALLSSRLTTNHSPDACSVHWSCWKAHQCSCWLHWEDEVRSFNWGLHSSSLTTSWIPQAFPPCPLSLSQLLPLLSPLPHHESHPSFSLWRWQCQEAPNNLCYLAVRSPAVQLWAEQLPVFGSPTMPKPVKAGS